MSFQSALEEASATPTRNRGAILWIFAGLLVLLGLAWGTYFFFSNGFLSAARSQSSDASEARSYRTAAKLELREQPNQASRVVAGLREGTTVSAVPAGTQDGVEWLEVTAVDGTKGFAPKSLLAELGPATSGDRISGGSRRLVVSTTVNLRETPSLSGRILGIAEGGTRLVADGTLQSEGEEWLRVPLDDKTTVFIMQRFTTFDDDTAANDGIVSGGAAEFGVRGFATQITNVQATPLPEARIVRALQVGEEVRIIGQTDAGQIWYVLRLADGSQGFAPRAMFRLDPNASRWVYPDGTVAPGPNIPKGATTPVTSNRSANRPSTSSGAASDTDTATPAPNPNPNTTPPTSTQSPTPITPPPPGAPVNLQPN